MSKNIYIKISVFVGYRIQFFPKIDKMLTACSMHFRWCCYSTSDAFICSRYQRSTRPTNKQFFLRI